MFSFSFVMICGQIGAVHVPLLNFIEFIGRCFVFVGLMDGMYDFEISNRILNEILKFNGNTLFSLFTQITHDFTLYSFVESVVSLLSIL
jgi:hypothetical protein